MPPIHLHKIFKKKTFAQKFEKLINVVCLAKTWVSWVSIAL